MIEKRDRVSHRARVDSTPVGCMNHALVHGNERLALLATATFLRSNGYPFQLTRDEAFVLIMVVAGGSMELPDIAARLQVGGG